MNGINDDPEDSCGFEADKNGVNEDPDELGAAGWGVGWVANGAGAAAGVSFTCESSAISTG